MVYLSYLRFDMKKDLSTNFKRTERRDADRFRELFYYIVPARMAHTKGAKKSAK